MLPPPNQSLRPKGRPESRTVSPGQFLPQVTAHQAGTVRKASPVASSAMPAASRARVGTASPSAPQARLTSAALATLGREAGNTKLSIISPAARSTAVVPSDVQSERDAGDAASSVAASLHGMDPVKKITTQYPVIHSLMGRNPAEPLAKTRRVATNLEKKMSSQIRPY